VFKQKQTWLAAYLMMAAVTATEVKAYYELRKETIVQLEEAMREINRCVASMIKLQNGHLDPVERRYLENSVDECPPAAFAAFATEPPSFIEMD